MGFKKKIILINVFRTAGIAKSAIEAAAIEYDSAAGCR